MKRTQWLGAGFLALALIACGNDTGDAGPTAGSGPDTDTGSVPDSDTDSDCVSGMVCSWHRHAC